MEYTVKQLADLAGVTPRTLRYYHAIGLLEPMVLRGGYRIYGKEQVNRLQRILFYKELGFDLDSIKNITSNPKFNYIHALKEHLNSLEEERKRLTLLIENVEDTILREEGVITMTDQEKFRGFQKEMAEENERIYGQEIRKKYGDEVVNESKSRFMNMTQEDYRNWKKLEQEILEDIKNAIGAGYDPKGDAGQRLVDKHKQWLMYTWTKYSSEAHQGLAEMYVSDERFKEYYDKKVDGGSEFLKVAILEHAK